MKKLVVGILAHVDAGKTTLSEGLLYISGKIRKLGRVDNKDAYLDTNTLEKERGITIFSKQAVFEYQDLGITLLDTPGHVDFSAEMERTLQVLDYAILVISGADGVQGHTETLWRLLKRYRIPVFLFINKMDQNGTDKTAILKELKERLSDGCLDFTEDTSAQFFEEAAMEDEIAMEYYLENGHLPVEKLQQMICDRKIFPCYFGSALKLQGVEEFLQGIKKYAEMPEYTAEFGARVFKISRDEQENRLTWLKVTGGSLKVKSLLMEQKVNQIRIYSGNKYETIAEAEAGCVCAVTGLEETFAGQGFGKEDASVMPLLEPVLHYTVILPEGYDAALMLPKLRQLEEEEPQLHIVWNEQVQEIQLQIMGEVQTEVLQRLVKERYGIEIAFGEGSIVYKETIANTVEGVGHFEPLRHYAEVHLRMEPGEPGSGMQFATECSEDMLAKNWQRLILTHLKEREHVGVLTGSPITDMKITLTAGRAHLKHTEGGDFRQATYRAVRQGLMQAENVLLEPYFSYRLTVPPEMIGRAMTDIEKMHGSFVGPFTEGNRSVLTGRAPVSCIRNYQKEVTAYTRGQGTITLSFCGYAPCYYTEEVVAASGYLPDNDLANPSSSVFCAHGAGFPVAWYEVADHMHIPSQLDPGEDTMPDAVMEKKLAMEEKRAFAEEERWIGTEEIDAILARTYQANKHDKGDVRRWVAKKKITVPSTESTRTTGKPVAKEEYLLVDGYNIIFAWEELKVLADANIDGARGRLMDILCNYQGIRKCNLIVVFDAYRVAGHKTEILDYHNIHVVYTKEAETADAYIEKFAHENGRKYRVTVATSDGLEQIIIRGQGCELLSARELKAEIERAEQALKETFKEQSEKSGNYLMDHASDEVKKQLDTLSEEE